MRKRTEWPVTRTLILDEKSREAVACFQQGKKEYAGTPGIPARNGFNSFLRAPR